MAAWLRTIAPIIAVVVTALTPVYGKEAWFVALVAIASAIGLAAPTVLPTKPIVTVHSSQETQQ